jgi:hypothetical protein
MGNEQKEGQDESYRGFDTPGQDRIINSSSDAVPSPSATSGQRLETPDAFIGGEVNERPGDANPALNETTGYEKGETSTADFLRARESAEEQRSRSTGKEMYADQTSGSEVEADLSYDPALDTSAQEAIYERREFDEPSEIPEEDLLGLRGSYLPPEKSDER